MSKIAVRTAIEGELTTFLTANYPAVPFVSTINEGSRPSNDTWVTVEYDAGYEEKVCYGGAKKIEYGSITIVVVSRAGVGYTPALTVAEALAQHFNSYYGGAVEVTGLTGPNDASGGDSDGSYSCELDMDYQYVF